MSEFEKAPCADCAVSMAAVRILDNIRYLIEANPNADRGDIVREIAAMVSTPAT